MNNDVKQEKIRQYMENLQKLNNGERAALKKSLGRPLSNADAGALSAFYKALPHATYPNEEEAYFLVGTSICFWKDANAQIKSFMNCLRGVKDESDASGGMDRRIIALLDMEWNEQDGYFVNKFSRLLRMIKQKGYTPDFGAMLNDLLLWKHHYRLIQRSWARTYFGDNNYQKTEFKEEN